MKKILIVSLGSIGLRHLRNTRELLPDAEIAVYRQFFRGDKSGENLVPKGADRIFFELNEALDFKPDGVIIASPASDHVKNATLFIENGASLFIEKPLAINYNETQELIKVCDQSKQFAMVGYVLRFQPILHYLKKLIDGGELGEVRTANVQVGQYLPDWRPDSDYRKGVSGQKNLGGGALLELSHELDYATWLFNHPDNVLCSSAKLSDLDIDVEDSACVVMEYGKTTTKKRVVVQVDFLQRVANMAVQVVGSKSTLYADLIKETAKIVSPEENESRELEVPRLLEGNEVYLRQFDFFFSKCYEDYSPRFTETKEFNSWVSVSQAAAVLKLVDVAKESSEKGSRLALTGLE